MTDALRALAGLPDTVLEAASSLYLSAPVDAAGPDYVNAVARLRTGLTAPALLAELQRLERSAGRQRPYRHAPRTLDLDLLAFDELRLRTPQLTLPHPRAHRRAFVVLPWLEIDPDISLPGLGPLAPWRERLGRDQRIDRLEPPPRMPS